MKPLRQLFKNLGIDKQIFWGLGVSFVVMIGTMGLFSFLFLSAIMLRSWLEQYIAQNVLVTVEMPGKVVSLATTTSPITTAKNTFFDLFAEARKKTVVSVGVPIPVNETLAPKQDLFYEVFYDLFSGTGWLDQGKTTMYHDQMMTAFLLPPMFQFEKSAVSPTVTFISRKSDGSDERCIRNACVRAQGTELFFNGTALSLPSEVQGATVVGVSVGSLSSVWPVGIVTKNGEDYSGWLFTFDGTNWKNVQRENKEVFVSRYGGTIGFGGVDTDWVAVYGAYEGRAVHIQQGALTDISRFFGIRVMAGGFDPEVTRVNARNTITWYVWNKGGFPKLVKLFENGTNVIVGATDLSSRLTGYIPRATSMYFSPTENPYVLITKVVMEGASEMWRFTDDGFDNNTDRQIVSASLTNRIMPAVRAKFAQIEYTNGGGRVQFYLTNNNVTWNEVKVAETGEVVFKDTSGDKVYWKASIAPSSDKYMSPYFGMIEIDYALNKEPQ